MSNIEILSNLEIFLETLAFKSYFLPDILGCALPINQLDFVDKWFTTENLLNNLLVIQKTVLQTHSFGFLNSTRQMTDTPYDKVCLNLSILIKAATFFDN